MLKCVEGRPVEIAIRAKTVHDRAFRMQPCDGNQPLGDRRIRGMGPPGAQKLRQNVGMRSDGRHPAGIRPADLLEHLDPPDAGQCDAVRMGRKDRGHGAAIRGRHRFSGLGPQQCDQIGISGADTEIDLRLVQPHVEQNGAAILLPQRCRVRADLGQNLALRHRRLCRLDAERDPLLPAMRARTQRLPCDGADRAHIRQAQAAPVSDDAAVKQARDRIARDMVELGNRAERAHRPSGSGPAKMVGDTGLDPWITLRYHGFASSEC